MQDCCCSWLWSLQVCTETYGTAPAVAITGSDHATLSYIPNHLDYMLFEVLKNAMRAVVEMHGTRSSSLPTIQIRIADAESCVTLRVSDQVRAGVAPVLWHCSSCKCQNMLLLMISCCKRASDIIWHSQIAGA